MKRTDTVSVFLKSKWEIKWAGVCKLIFTNSFFKDNLGTSQPCKLEIDVLVEISHTNQILAKRFQGALSI